MELAKKKGFSNGLEKLAVELIWLVDATQAGVFQF
jgi:hypothetical protein